MIKECPTCRRTYSDQSITFCLADGSLLSAPFDPQATQQLPLSQSPEPMATALMPPPTAPDANSLPARRPAIEAAEMPQTIASAAADDTVDGSAFIEQQSAGTAELAGLSGRKGVKLWVGLGLFFAVAAAYTQSIIPALPALAMFLIALLVGLKKRGYEQL
jgi:hypothetical protein